MAVSDVDRLWITVERALDDMTTLDRAQARKVLIRRLRHPEMGAHPEATPPQNNRRGPMPKIASPLCYCGAPRSKHAEDGTYDPNGCGMYMSAR